MFCGDYVGPRFIISSTYGIQTYTEPLPLKYGKLAAYTIISGYFLHLRFFAQRPSSTNSQFAPPDADATQLVGIGRCELAVKHCLCVRRNRTHRNQPKTSTSPRMDERVRRFFAASSYHPREDVGRVGEDVTRILF